MVSTSTPRATDTTESIDITLVPPTIATSINGDAAEASNHAPEILAQPGQQRSKFKMFSIMTALFSATFISALNTTIVATAIPTICADLDSAVGYSWVGAAYVIATTAVGPVWTKFSDIWGRKPILLTAVALYFASSMICALSTSMGMLIVARALQGVSGGGVGSLINVVISDMFSMRTRPLFLGLLQVTWAVAGGIGPVLGGAFTQYLSWRWIFWINLPVCGVAFGLLLLFLDVHDPKTRFVDGIKAVDWAGSFSLIGLMVMVLLGLNFGGATFPWDSPKVLCLIAFGILVAIFFLFNEARLAQHPVMPLGVFRQRSNAACLIIGFIQHFVLNAAEYYLPLYFQSAKEASPLYSGVLLLPLIMIEAAAATASGIFIHRLGRYLDLIWLGVLFMTLGNGLYVYLGATTSIGSIAAFQLVAGFGIGLLFDPPLIALQALVSQDDTATATATLGSMRGLGVALSIIIGGVIFQNGIQLQSSSLRAHGLSADLVEELAGPNAATKINLINTISDPAQKLAVKQAFAWSLRNLWITCTGMAAIAVVASSLITKKELAREHVETQTGIRKEKQNAGSDAANRDDAQEIRA
ncbi:uncharacterized protein A1O9_03906 [Exophiala aquamarina CBS 119918]|uniref:Major facilitator superfamily (MFS) profile domain-containing protein n=1 Tax=Exophiala aquamarina CBS 119918 TaxID=1182545 RepID=A0A072PIB4_9EURO|nr:uncharacterized protein A1O9_03906 [Exophiala aquamarina CBS 119918]KEF59063.1 hypothetical protein A1O9_03906 [Exophiala aquamarina CBS 119918]